MIKSPHTRKPARARRGVTIAAALLAVMILGLTVAGSVVPLAQEADLSALRVETTRAFYAAESGSSIILSASKAGLTLPESGDGVDLGSQSVRFLEVPEGQGDLVLQGRSGQAARRILIRID